MRFGFLSLTLDGISSPKFSKFFFLADLVHPGSTLPSREGFWKIETWVIRPRPSLRLHSYKRDSCRGYATQSKYKLTHTLKERLPNTSLACRGVKKIQSSNTGRICCQFVKRK